MKRTTSTHKPSGRRGVVAVQVIVMLTVILGFAALTVDIGAMYNARGDLQIIADAGALAAAGALGDYSTGNPLEQAKAAALEYASRNTVLGKPIELDPSMDIILGRAIYDPASRSFNFTPTTYLPDAVQIRARLSNDSPNGAMPLFFAGILGTTTANISAEAIAMMAARDIAVVADLSGSHNDDSELRQYKNTEINLFSVWDDLPGGVDDEDNGLWDLSEIPADWVQNDGSISQAAGPGWGYFRKTGWGWPGG